MKVWVVLKLDPIDGRIFYIDRIFKKKDLANQWADIQRDHDYCVEYRVEEREVENKL